MYVLYSGEALNEARSEGVQFEEGNRLGAKLLLKRVRLCRRSLVQRANRGILAAVDDVLNALHLVNPTRLCQLAALLSLLLLLALHFA